MNQLLFKFNSKKTNIFIRSICKHRDTSLNEFNEFYINDLFDKVSKENKMVFLLGDFNTKLLDYDQGTSNEFIDFLSSQLFLPHVLQPAKERYDSKTILYYVFSNAVLSYIIIGNLMSSISDHLPQLLIFFPTPKLKI